jgi:hypothetical protein
VLNGGVLNGGVLNGVLNGGVLNGGVLNGVLNGVSCFRASRLGDVAVRFSSQTENFSEADFV